jgi:hypothetical protein
LQDCFGELERFSLEVKKLPDGKKAKKQTVFAVFAQNLLRQMAHCWRLPGTVSPGYVALDLCYISLLKLGFPVGQHAHVRRPFPCGDIGLYAGKLLFCHSIYCL